METFFSTSEKVQHIIKSFNLTKTLFVSSIIIGEAYTGKKSLARSLFPNTPMVSGNDQKGVEEALEDNDELIITNFEKLSNQNALDFSNKRIIATADYIGNPELIDDLFAFIYTMPSLQERPEDIHYLKDMFIKEACSTLMVDKSDIEPADISVNLTKNSKSMKRSIYMHIMRQSMNSEDIENVLYHYLLKNLDGNDGYREYLGLYEKPLIEAGLKKFGSQLQLSQVLGINRNTLRKKIHEHNID
jgi:DNA-binding NtrC family response regulator